MIPIGCWPHTTSDNSDVKWRQMENVAKKLQWFHLYLQRYFEKFSSFLSSLTMATMEMSHLLVMQWFQSAYQSDVIGVLCVL